jgi:hypothetical protein
MNMDRIESLLSDHVQKLSAIHAQQGEILTQIALIHERQGQKQKDIEAIQEIQKGHAESLHRLDKAEDKNSTARAAAWVGAISLAGMLLISAWNSWQDHVETMAARAIEKRMNG